ncbi:cilia- and flagella-associated protein 46 isoform X8 [Willisornis vidua]|uniref:Cilia- and flagella-associated protein 46 isoform X8 n=1 Tax=Willisornis vidua TaxID=1566151 RepID=A0ABQ9DRY7_9PASS|nr:cilia- and flagella-associated protein 46 isoform X8 [Willisornis vidua]
MGYLEMSSDCLQMYFKGRFPVNQFLGRAYLCQGQLHAPHSTDNLEEFEKFVLFFMKAIDFGSHDRRNLLKCFLDASKLEEAKEFSSAAAVFIKENVPEKYSQIFSLMEQGKLIEIECLEYEYEMKKNSTKIVTYTKGVVEAQLKLIKNLELTLKRAVQLGDPDVIQVVCATQWNLCLPLLQHNLHQHVRKPLISVADALEEIDSLLTVLRCQVHMEIARIEEDGDRLEAAVAHLQKAAHLDSSGQYQEHLRLSLNRLRWCTELYQAPERQEDRAGVMVEQAKRGKQNDNVRKKRSLLVNAGLALAPDTFQIVLDSENEAKGKSQISFLCAKAQHHIKSVEKIDEHLKHLRNENGRERIILWANLAKVARKQEVWDVCRAACRFCLLYEDSLFREVSKPKKTQKSKAGAAEMVGGQGGTFSGESLLPANSFSLETHLLRILAEIRFINAEATVHLLRLQGIELNDHAVPPEDTNQYHPEDVSYLPESDPEWKTYSLWIDCLSGYAMENFLRAAEIGELLHEAWIVHNAVVYILNYNRHLITSGRQREIIEYLQTLLGAIKTVGHNGSTEILLMLCNALSRSLIIPWIPEPKPAVEKEDGTAIDSGRKAAAKKHETANVTQSLSVDPSGLPDIKAALEICEFALNVMTGTTPKEMVPVAAQQQVIATWVKAKQLNQQQIRNKPGTQDENNDEAQNPMARILVDLEMYSCNGLGLMDFTVPGLSQLVKLALECSWSDSLVELQTLTRLTYFAYVSQDYEIVTTCSKRILESDGNSVHNRDTKKLDMPGDRVRQEMLSTTACIQGQSIMENLSGRKHLRVAAAKAFAQSARYAGEAGNYSLVMFAARHFWNACLPWLGSPHDREQLKEPTEIILKSIIKAESKNKQSVKATTPLGVTSRCADSALNRLEYVSDELNSVGPSKNLWDTTRYWFPLDVEPVTGTLQVQPSSHFLVHPMFHPANLYLSSSAAARLWGTVSKVSQKDSLIFKHMATVRAGLGRNFMVAIQKISRENKEYLSQMWRHLATVSRSTAGQLSCFQNAIIASQKQEDEWQSVDCLMEFAEWLYCNQFPFSDAIKPLDWAVDLLLRMKFPVQPSQEEENIGIPECLPTENTKMDSGANGTMPHINLEDLSNIKQLEALFRAQTLMAVISGAASPCHRQHCLLACACIARIWQISLSASGFFIKASSKSSQPTTPPKKEKGKRKEKQLDVFVAKEKPKVVTLPASVEEWAQYDCPNEVRDAFKQNTNSYGINWNNFPKPLAEVIASEVVECRSLSDLYHLRIALICSDLKLSQASVYHERAAGETHISDLEQAMCRQEIALKKSKTEHTKIEERKISFENAELNISKDVNTLNSSEKVFELNAATGKGLSALSFPSLWIEKADVLIQLGLYQPARLLLAEAHAATQELRALSDVSRCLYLLAVLANMEKNHRQAKALLEKAQLLGGDEQFWYNSTLSLTEAILEEEVEGKWSMACEILGHTVKVLQSTSVRRPGRQAELGFMVASLEARKILIQIHFAQDHMTINAESAQLPHMLQEYYNKLLQIEKDFVHYGHKNSSAEILLECANIHRMIAKQKRNRKDKHSHYIDACKLAQMAVSKTEEVFQNVWSLFAFNESANISIPLMRQLANRKIKLVEILLDIFHLVITEKKRKEVGEASPHEIVEAFIIEEDASEQDWKHMECTVGHLTLAQLANVQNLCKGCPDIRSKCLYLTGKTLHLLAIDEDPVSSEVYWNPNVMEEAKSDIKKSSLTSAECREQDGTDRALLTDKCPNDKYRRKIQELKKAHLMAQKYLSQSSEALLQCMGIAFSQNITDTLTLASLEMAECFRQFDPVSTSQFLALHQPENWPYRTCGGSLVITELLSVCDDEEYAPSSYIQHQQLSAGSIAASPESLKTKQKHEQSSKMCGTATGYFFNVQAKVSRFPVNPDAFRVLLEKVHLYKQQKIKSHFKQNVIQNLQECVSKSDVTPTEKTDDNGLDSTSDFSEILEMMEEYLKPVLSQFDFSALRESQCVMISAAESGKKNVKDKDTKQAGMRDTAVGVGLCVVLLGDPLLMELPLEALSVFKEEGISSVSRDFSLQILYNRQHLAESDIVDPYNEGREAEASSPSQKIKEILEKYHDLFTVQWEGVTGNMRVPSQAEWEQLLTSCSAFLFYGMERFMSHLLLNRLVAMNIPKCHLMILLDLVRSEQSYQRITNSDIHKSCLHVALESPTATAMLLSLPGAGCVVATQWCTSLQENAERLEMLLHMEVDSPSPPGDRTEQAAQDSSGLPATHPSFFNCVLYGLPNIILV